MWILLQLAALAVVTSGQTDCSRGACYPPAGDLLIGRGQQLHASSTCGLTGSEVFCTPLHLWKMKCCPCDSRNPSSPLAHRVQNVLSTAGTDRWWQSKKDANPVTLQLNLQSLFQLEKLDLIFKGPRPSALVVERTADNGQTWQPAVYMASNCRSAFPGVATTTPRSADQASCYTLPPVTPNPYQDQAITFSLLRQNSAVSVPGKIPEAPGWTGLRLRLTQPGAVPRLPGRSPSQFYALKEMRAVGACMCHGHADRCLPEASADRLPNKQVGAKCECQHNTAGLNCERCAALYNDLPWRPAQQSDAHACQRCECNNHAQSCRFDRDAYERSGRRSGGVCEGCLHHTDGPRCERCAPGYQRNPRSRMDRADACTRCHCSAEGAESGAPCDDTTGSCRCKANAEGPRCDRCRRGFYGLASSNPLGCSKCSCSDGSLSSVCDPQTGQCRCRPGYHGVTCDSCSHGYWNPSSPGGCEPCRCDLTNSRTNTCDQVTGQCVCRSGFGGRTCAECPDNTYGDPLIGCRPCQCVAEGTLPGGCDKRTGSCRCRLGVAGVHCDACNRARCDAFPGCDVCPSCFFTLDAQIRNLTLGLERLSPSLPSPSGGPGPSDLGPRLRALEARLAQVRDSLPLPPPSARLVDEALARLHRLGDQVDQADGNLALIKPRDGAAGLGSELDELQALLDGLSLELDAKRDAIRNAVGSNNTGDFSAIKKAYNQSADAAKRVAASSETVDRSTAVRQDALDLQKQIQPANVKDLDKLTHQLSTKPNLTPAAKQVCGSVRSAPCTPLQCEGQLCPASGAPPCGRGERCVGTLPLGTRAVDDAEEVKDRLQELNDKITDAAAKIQQTQATAKQVRKTTDQLSEQMRKAQGDLEQDLKETRDFVKELKDFLSDPTSNLTLIREVSEWVLSAKLPVSLSALQRKLREMKDLAAGLPDSTAVLDQAGPQLDTARRLLQEARDARDSALGVKADVDGLLEGFSAVEDSLSGVEDKLQASRAVIDDLNNNLKQVKAELGPGVKTLGEVTSLTDAMKPQLEEIKAMLNSGGQLAQNATGEAGKAKREADAAAEDLATLQRQLEKLQAAERASGRGDGAGSAGERLQRLQEEAGSLARDTGDMMAALTGKADSLRQLQDQVLEKTKRLSGLDTKLQDILADLRQKVTVLSTCQG